MTDHVIVLAEQTRGIASNIAIVLFIISIACFVVQFVKWGMAYKDKDSLKSASDDLIFFFLGIAFNSLGAIAIMF